jgi:hypothetical protein
MNHCPFRSRIRVLAVIAAKGGTAVAFTVTPGNHAGGPQYPKLIRMLSDTKIPFLGEPIGYLGEIGLVRVGLTRFPVSLLALRTSRVFQARRWGSS